MRRNELVKPGKPLTLISLQLLGYIIRIAKLSPGRWSRFNAADSTVKLADLEADSKIHRHYLKWHISISPDQLAHQHVHRHKCLSCNVSVTLGKPSTSKTHAHQ